MRIFIITLLAFISTVASAQLSRSFNQDFVARVGVAEEFAIFLVEDDGVTVVLVLGQTRWDKLHELTVLLPDFLHTSS